MENIINTILDIDKAASDRLEEAQKNKIQVIAYKFCGGLLWKIKMR